MSLRYDFDVDPTKKNTVYARIINWAEPGKRVLDVGCDTGNLAAALKGRGLHAEGVEMDPAAAELAKARLDRVYVGSIVDEALLAELDGPYDIIVFADVLEHLARPDETLYRMKKLLSPGGVIIASLPNVANFRVRFRLLLGRFEYTEIGILDRTHLRFYTGKTGRGLFQASGYKVTGQLPAATHIPGLLLMLWPGLFATRFVIRARVAQQYDGK